MAAAFRRLFVLLLGSCLICVLLGDKEKAKKKKDIRDYNDADMARLLEEWEVCVALYLLRGGYQLLA